MIALLSLSLFCFICLIPLNSSFRLYKARSFISKYRLSSSDDFAGSNKDFNRIVLKPVTDTQSIDLIQAFSSKDTDVFDFSTFSINNNQKSKILTKESFYQWEKQIDKLLIDLKSLKYKKETVLSLYTSILSKAATQVLDPLQTATFELIVFSLIDTLLDNHPKEVPITTLIESMTTTNIAYVDKFTKEVMVDDGGSDGYSQSSNQEYLCYQFAGLMLKVYTRFVYALGIEYDNSKPTQELRLNAWVEPVLRELESRCVRFLISNVEEKIEEMYSASFDRFLDTVEFEIKPRYSITSSASGVPTSNSNINTGSDIHSSSTTTTNAITNTVYRDWDYANFMSKVIRNTINNVDLNSLESKVIRLFQSEISVRMRKLGRSIEKILDKKYNNDVKLTGVAVTDIEQKMVEDMLNIGHSVTAAVYVIWHVRHNIVGVMNKEGVFDKDYILPLSISDGYNKTLDGIPKNIRTDVKGDVDLMYERYTDMMTQKNQSVSAICSAVRATATEEFRAIITYNSNSEEWPDSRDDVFVAVLSSYIFYLLTSSSHSTWTIDATDEVYENMIALAALDESIGVREPRAAVTRAFILGIQAALAAIYSSSTSTSTSSSTSTSTSLPVEEFKNRINFIEFMLSICLRLPEGSGSKCRQLAFEKFIQSYIENGSSNNDANDDENGMNASIFKDIDRVYPLAAGALSIDINKAKAYVAPLGLSMFDKLIGSMLMNADIAVSMPELGEILQMQLHDFADGISLPRDQAQGRILYIAAAVLQSFLEASLEENRRMNINNVDTILVKCFYLCEHPLIKLLSITTTEVVSSTTTSTTTAATAILNEKTKSLKDVKMTAIKMTNKRIGPQLFIEMVRLVEAARQRIAALDSPASGGQQSISGWGGSSSVLNNRLARDPKFQEFLSSLQTSMLKEYTASAMKKNFGNR